MESRVVAQSGLGDGGVGVGRYVDPSEWHSGEAGDEKSKDHAKRSRARVGLVLLRQSLMMMKRRRRKKM